MTREQARALVLDYVYGELSPGDASAFEAVLREDPELRAEVEAVAFVQRAASGLERPELPILVRGRLVAAARRESRRRAMARRWEALEKLFLSPVFLGATGIIAAVGVGIHLILTQGTEDPWARMDREQRTAVLSSAEPPAASPAEDEAARVAEASLADREKVVTPAAVPPRRETAAALQSTSTLDRTGGAGGKAAWRTKASKARSTAEDVEAWEGPAVERGGMTSGSAGTGYGGGIARGDSALASPSAGERRGRASQEGSVGLLSRPAPSEGSVALRTGKKTEASGPPPVAAPGPTAILDRSTEDLDLVSGAEEAPRAPAKEERGRFATPPPVVSAPAARSVLSASEPESAADARPAQAKAARVEAEDPAGLLAEARDLRAGGYLHDALDAYRRALTAGPSGDVLADTLAEAAELARTLGRTAEADGYLARLERLPGGTARAAKIRAK